MVEMVVITILSTLEHNILVLRKNNKLDLQASILNFTLHFHGINSQMEMFSLIVVETGFKIERWG